MIEIPMTGLSGHPDPGPNRKEVIQCLIVYRRGRRHP
jgi:hypothetical protein